MIHPFSKLTLSKKILLLPYVPSFLCIAIALYDIVFLHGTILKILPKSLYEVFLYTALFELPHILASFFMFGDRSYREHFKKRLNWNFYILLISLLLIIFCQKNIFYFIYLFCTFYHLVKQQFGIAKMYHTRPSSYMTLLPYGFILSGTFALFQNFTAIPSLLYTVIVTTIPVLLTMLFFIVEKENRKNIYLFLCVISFSCIALLFGFGYTLLALLSARVIHDLTAFMFYSVHGHNRKEESSNLIYTSFLTKNIPPLILTPVLAISSNLMYLYLVFLTKEIPFLNSILIFGYVLMALFHYNLEGVIWRKDSPVRNYVPVV